MKKALGVVLDASHTTAFAYSANANIRVGTYEDCKDAQIIINTAGPSIQPGNSVTAWCCCRPMYR
ncbi:MAG: lactate/malate family dehydrogenase [Blautia marasmi]